MSRAAEHSLHQSIVPEWKAAGSQSLGDLHIPEFSWRCVGESQTESNFFTTTMDQDRRLVICHQFPPGAQILNLEGIDGDTAFGGGKLKQAEFRTVGVFRDKFGIKCYELRLADVLAKIIEISLGRDERRRHR